MRQLLIDRIVQNWRDGYYEMNCWAIAGLDYDDADEDTESPAATVLTYGSERYPIPRFTWDSDEKQPQTDIRPLLNQLSDAELIEAFDGQCCQRYR